MSDKTVMTIKNKLLKSLGPKKQDYIKLMSLWFRMKLSKDKLDAESAKLLTPYQVRLHNQLLLRLLKNVVGLVRPTAGPVPRKYEPIHPAEYVVTERLELDIDMPWHMSREGALYDHHAMLDRMRYGAKELGLVGCTPAAAQLLLLAMQNFLKNIITAVVARRRGFKVKSNGFIHGLGRPTVSPWLKNSTRENNDPSHSLLIDEDVEGFLRPNMRRTAEEIERELVFHRVASGYPNDKIAPVSIQDLLLTLKLFPNLIASNFVKTVNCERMYARVRHSYYDV